MSEIPALAAAAIVGYLAGSISFTRLVARVVLPGESLEMTRLAFGDDGRPVDIRGVSATSLSVRAGRRWALVVVALDMAKAALPTLAFGLLAPGTEAALGAAAAAVAGHVWPAWHRFVGGFGVSPILGALLVIDPLAIPATIVVAGGIGLLLADRLIAYDGWTVLLGPWFVLRGETAEAVWALVVAGIYWWAMRTEVIDHLRRVRRGGRPWRERLGDIRAGYTGEPDDH